MSTQSTNATQSIQRAAIRGFDAEFRDLPHYIVAITERIWEGHCLDDIYRYYSDPCVVVTPGGVSTSVEAVVQGTAATQVTFPDRRLLAEDVIWSGDDARGFLSSHRIISTMTHLGEGAFGAPTGKRIQVRTIADCWCIENRISHEWLVRDQAAIAKAIGVAPDSLARAWLAKTDGVLTKPPVPRAPAPFIADISDSPDAAAYAAIYRALWQNDIESAIDAQYDQAITALTPAETTRYGARELTEFWAAYRQALTCQSFTVEHLIERNDPGRPTRVAMRWHAQCTHTGQGFLGEPTGKAIEVMGISHTEILDGRVLREWILIDEIALWMQVLCVRANQPETPLP